MTLVVEDGSRSDPLANSYVSRSDFIAYADAAGVDVPDDPETDAVLVKAARFIDSHRDQFVGELIARDQPMQWPRSWVSLEGWPWSPAEIPRQVRLLQLELAMDIRDGVDPYNPPPNPSRAVKRQRVEGVVSVEYMGQDSGAKLSRRSQWQALLSQLLYRSGMSVALVRS